MTTKDTYHTILEPGIGEFRDRGSKFLAYAFPVNDESQCQEKLEEVRKSHPKARHYCYAYRIGLEGLYFRANDDGEPSGTAGRPILGQIDSFGLVNIIVIVVRYFGGTLLGVSGLINAYKSSAADALVKSTIITKTVEDIYRVSFDYSLMSSVMNTIKKLDLEMVQQNFQDIGSVDVAIKQSEVEMTLRQMRAGIAGVFLEEVDGLKEIKGLDIQYCYTR